MTFPCSPTPIGFASIGRSRSCASTWLSDLGPHFCAGAHLARMEARITLREVMGRMPALRLNGPSERLTTTFSFWAPQEAASGVGLNMWQGLLGRAGTAFAHRTALMDFERTLTYAELCSRVDAFAAQLQRAGVAAGDRVVILTGKTSRRSCRFMRCCVAAARVCHWTGPPRRNDCVIPPMTWRPAPASRRLHSSD